MALGMDGQVNNNNIQQLQRLLRSMPGARTQATKRVDVNLTKEGSIFNLVSSNQTRQNAAIRDANSTPIGNITNANLRASVSNVQQAFGADATSTNNNVSQGTSASNNVVTQNDDGSGSIDLDAIDYSNLGQYSLNDLQSIKTEIQNLLDNDCPFWLRAPFESKLDKVETTIQTKEQEQGITSDDDNNQEESASNSSKISAAISGAATARSASAQAQEATNNMNNTSKETQNLEKEIVKQQNNLRKTQQRAQKTIEKNIQAVETEAQNIAELLSENEGINAETETLTNMINDATASATTRAGAQDQISDLNARIQTNQTRIVVNNARLGRSSIAMHRYITANNRTVRSLTRTNRAYTSRINAAQSQIMENQNEQSGFMKTMDKINDISSKVALIGSATKYAGIALQSTSWTGVGAAIATTMINTGLMAETGGNYGVCVANVGKTAGYVAEGNIMAAITSAGTAIMSGAVAFKNTQTMANQVKTASHAAENAKNAAQQAQQIGQDAGQEVTQQASQEGVQQAGQQATQGANSAQQLTQVTDSGLTLTDAGQAQMDNTLNQINRQVTRQGLESYAQTEASKAGFSGWARGVAAEVSKNTTGMQALMGFGQTLQTAAAMFDRPEEVTAQATTRSVHRGGRFRRRKIA